MHLSNLELPQAEGPTLFLHAHQVYHTSVLSNTLPVAPSPILCAGAKAAEEGGKGHAREGVHGRDFVAGQAGHGIRLEV